MKNNKYRILALCLVLTTACYAQPGFDENVEDVAAIPGLFLAIVTAIGIGVSKFSNNK